MVTEELKPLLDELERAQRAADKAELNVVRTALKLADGYVKRAAQLLGWYREKLLRFLRAHPELLERAEVLRERDGWTGGRPRDDTVR
jgi:hypothetical protein